MQDACQRRIHTTILTWRWQFVGICAPGHQTMRAKSPNYLISTCIFCRVPSPFMSRWILSTRRRWVVLIAYDLIFFTSPYSRQLWEECFHKRIVAISWCLHALFAFQNTILHICELCFNWSWRVTLRWLWMHWCSVLLGSASEYCTRRCVPSDNCSS